MNLHNAEFVRSVTAVADCPKDDLPQIAFAGKSNVGKSSVINKLLLRKNFARVGQAPGKTTHINFFCIDKKLYLVDLPGYGYAKLGRDGKQQIAEIIKDYITSSEDLVMLFVLVDSRHDMGHIDIDFINELGEHGIPFSIIMTKCEKQGPNVLAARLERNSRALLEQWEELPEVLCSSSKTGSGKEEILSYIDRILNNLNAK